MSNVLNCTYSSKMTVFENSLRLPQLLAFSMFPTTKCVFSASWIKPLCWKNSEVVPGSKTGRVYLCKTRFVTIVCWHYKII